MMATPAQWIGGARPRTLPAAVAPIAVAAGLAAYVDALLPARVALALIVSLALQVGVNYANDYSDGVRGTDRERVGPVRLVGQGLAEPRRVRTAAFAAFGAAAIAGLVLVWVSGQWWLLIVGAASVAAAWLYTGGPRPYGYAGLGELFVFVFFGIVPVLATVYVQAYRVGAPDVVAAVGVGLLACAILLTNNLRDIAGDTAAGKRTLAVRIGDRATRVLYVVIVTVAVLVPVALAAMSTWRVALASLTAVVAIRPVRTILSGALGPRLIGPLKDTGLLLLLYGLAIGLVLGL